jgi:hypothetical protein
MTTRKDSTQLWASIDAKIRSAEALVSHLPTDAFTAELYGMSSKYGRHLMNNLLSDNEYSYLEIGTFAGSMLISALYGNLPRKHWGIDDWSDKYWPDGVSAGKSEPEFFKNVQQYLNIVPNFFEVDCFAINPLDPPYNIKDVDVYFYDGAHREIDGYNAIMHYFDSLSDQFILLVDDWNVIHQRMGTERAINELILAKKLEVHYERTLPSLSNGGDPWWNGLYIAVGEKQTN